MGDAEPKHVEVMVRSRGQREEGSRGAILLEDLEPVLTRISHRRGPNGPNGPVTQYILAEAARHLSDRIVGDLGAHAVVAEVPKVLSSLIGHEPFVENSLDLSPHQMRRRWPLATDWYADLIAYVLRPHRYSQNAAAVASQLVEWLELPFGEFVERFAVHQSRATQEPGLFRLAATIYALWPEYPPIQKAYADHRAAVQETWSPLYRQLLHHYGLALHPSVDLEDLCWMLDTIVTRVGDDATLGAGGTEPWVRAARTVLIYVSGAVTASDGELLTLEELAARSPQTP